MKFFLKIKHWQLFVLTWGPALLANFLPMIIPISIFQLFPFVMIPFVLGILGWIWAISTVLHSKLPTGVNLNINQFRILFLIPLVYTAYLTFWLSYNTSEKPNENMALQIGLFVFLHLLSMICLIMGMRFAAKTMKSVELGRMAKFGDYAAEFVLLWCCPIGIWILQPRLNKLSQAQA